MTQRTYKGKVAPSWAEYVVFGPLSGMAHLLRSTGVVPAHDYFPKTKEVSVES